MISLRQQAQQLIGVAFGISVHLLFAVTVVFLFLFLAGELTRTAGSLWMDIALTLQFAVVHSILLHPTTQRRLGTWIKRPFYGLFFCLMTCAGLLLTISQWRTSEVMIWNATGWQHTAVVMAFGFSWVALFYSLFISGLGWQTGLTPWWQWARRQPLPRRSFEEHSLYRWFRHPIYLSFLGLIWFTPHMSLDRALLTGVWTVYIFLGSWLKDRRLEFYMGNKYREYESRVPGYPLLYRGPLGIRSFKDAERTAA